jgi:pimeloyl-ACP methyl ester carboxylesterase
MTENVFFKNSKNQKIYGGFEEPNISKDEVVIIVHGFSSFSKSHLPDELAKININSFRIDLDNRGKSEPDFQEEASISNYMNTLESAIDLAKSRGYKSVSLLGISFGGNVVLATSLKHPEIKRIVLMAPSIDYPSAVKSRFSKGELEKSKKEGYYSQLVSTGEKVKVNYSCLEDSQKYVMFGKAKNINIPVLIIHGTEDEEVDCRGSEKIIKEFSNGKLILIQGASHQLAVNGDFSKGKEALREWFKGDV